MTFTGLGFLPFLPTLTAFKNSDLRSRDSNIFFNIPKSSYFLYSTLGILDSRILRNITLLDRLIWSFISSKTSLYCSAINFLTLLNSSFSTEFSFCICKSFWFIVESTDFISPSSIRAAYFLNNDSSVSFISALRSVTFAFSTHSAHVKHFFSNSEALWQSGIHWDWIWTRFKIYFVSWL